MTRSTRSWRSCSSASWAQSSIKNLLKLILLISTMRRSLEYLFTAVMPYYGWSLWAWTAWWWWTCTAGRSWLLRA